MVTQRFHGIIIAALVLLFLAVTSSAQKTQLAITINPTIYQNISNIINNTIFNITGGFHPNGGYLYNDTTSMYWNQTHGDLRYVLRSNWNTFDNYPSNCPDNQYAYGIGDTLLCRQDQTGSVDLSDYYTKSQTENLDNATNTSATGFCSALDTSTNASIKDWIIGQSYLTSETNWNANYSGYNKTSWDSAYAYVTNDTFYRANNPSSYITAAIDSATNTTVVNWANGKFLTSYTESDPLSIRNTSWLNCTGLNNFTSSLGICSVVSFSGYYTSAQTDTAIGNANTSVVNWVSGQNYLKTVQNITCTGSNNFTISPSTCSQPTGYLTFETDPKLAVLTANKWCTANSTGTGINCTANAPSVGSESDPYWTANQSSYVSWVTGNLSYMNFSSLLPCGRLTGNATNLCTITQGMTSELDPYWTANQSSYYTKTQSNSTYLKYSEWVNCTGNNFVNALGSCTEPTAGNEIDPYWSSNYTACTSSQKLYFSGTSLACANDLGITTESDPSWTGNYTACSSSQKLYFDASKNLACANDLGGAEVDPYNSALNSSVYAWWCDYQAAAAATMCPGWTGAAISSGTEVANTTDPERNNHPGINTFRSSTTTNSGWQFSTDATLFLIAGGETTQFIFKTLNTSIGYQVRMGFIDSVAAAIPTDGLWLNISGTNLTGSCMSSSAKTCTAGAGYTITGNTWYHGTIIVNSGATNVTFRLQNAAGTVLWEQYCTSNIPTGAGRYTGHGVASFLIGVTAYDSLSIDYMSVYIARSLVR